MISLNVWKSKPLGVEPWQSNLIKLIAITSMLADHIGVVFFPNDSVWRMAGRIALPLFAYQLGVAYQHTRNRRKYALRLLLFGLLSQTPYYLVRQERILNIFFTLLLGLGAISLYAEKKYNWLMLYLLATLAVGFVLPYDYGAYGVCMILIFYALPNPAQQGVGVVCLTSLYALPAKLYIQMFCLLALPLLWGIRSLRVLPRVESAFSRINKWIFYAFYPLHLTALWALRALST